MALDLSEYKKISTIILLSFLINIICIIGLHFFYIEQLISDCLGIYAPEFIKQFFYGSLGATVAVSVFMAKDKDINEVESLEANPDPKKLRLPDPIDIKLYIHRIISSGILSVFGMLIILAGFGYLEVDIVNEFQFKQKLIFAISSILIGLNQAKYLKVIDKLFDNFFDRKSS